MENKRELSKLSLDEMVQNLIKVDDISWGMYAFSRDLLRNRFSYNEKRILIPKAIECGKKKAREIAEKYGTANAKELAAMLGVNVEYVEQGQTVDRILFALFTPPNNIEIMKEPVKRALVSKEVSRIVTENDIELLILAHEIFHFLEEEDKEIFTRNEKIELWRFFGYKHRSAIRALSEIAATYFAKELNATKYHPFLLDVILYYSYNEIGSEKLYSEIIAIWQQESLDGEYK